MHQKISSAKIRPFRPGRDILKYFFFHYFCQILPTVGATNPAAAKGNASFDELTFSRKRTDESVTLD